MDALKKSHTAIPMKMNIEKYGSEASKTYPKTKVYKNIKHSGVITHHSQFKYEPATSALSSYFAIFTENGKYFFKSFIVLFNTLNLHIKLLFFIFS